MLTDYQTAKNAPPVRIQIIKSVYLKGTEIADKNLCRIARKNRQRLYDKSEALCKKMLQFLCHLNQQNWRGKALLTLIDNLFATDAVICKEIDKLEVNFYKKGIKILKIIKSRYR
ncbi:hypothetical protein P4S63_16985 [Pseudoalteromonas sp. B193]